MTYDAVISDVGGVVVDMETDRLLHQVSQLVGRPFDEVQAAVYDKTLLLPFELGKISAKTYYQELKKRLKLPWAYEQFTTFWTAIFTENREVTHVLSRLSARHRLVALTNTNELHLEYLKRSIPSLSFFCDWVASCDVGCRKPEPEIYHLALRRAGVRADRAVYIDDRPEMVEAGRQVGLKAIRFEDSRQLERELEALGINA